MVNKDKQISEKISNEASLIAEFLEGVDFERFASDERTRRAICMTLINIGELVKILSDEFRHENNHIPWRAIAGLRDVTAHRYQTLRFEDIWETVTKDIPELLELISKIM
ncbi:MAG: DUF86 domain-containing protein [Synergistaceae bacterium]|jgi:uncharacterized protein with HEPN domain|nr:DUF86 domain-containing protein [Synergistaceae bacterium]